MARLAPQLIEALRTRGDRAGGGAGAHAVGGSAPTLAATPRDRTLTALALALVLATLVVGVVAAGVALASTGASAEARAAGQALSEGLAGVDVSRPGAISAAVGAWFVGILVALLPGCAAVMLAVASPLLDARRTTVACLLPVGAITVMAVLSAIVVGAGAPGWLVTGVAVVLGIALVAGGVWVVWRLWCDVRGVRVAARSEAAAVPSAVVPSAVVPSAIEATVVDAAASDAAYADAPAEAEGASLRTHPLTARIGAWAVLAAGALAAAGSVLLVRSAAFLPPDVGVMTAALPAWYTIGSGFAASAFLWGTIWLVGAVLLQVSARASIAASRLAWAFVPMVAVGTLVGVVVGWGAAQAGAPDVTARALAVALILATTVALCLWAWRNAPVGVREIGGLLVGQGRAAGE